MSKPIQGYVPCQHCETESPVYLPSGGNRKDTFYYVCPNCKTQQSKGVGEYCQANMIPAKTESESVVIDNDSGKVVEEPEHTKSNQEKDTAEKGQASTGNMAVVVVLAGLIIGGVGYGAYRWLSRSKSTPEKTAPNSGKSTAEPVKRNATDSLNEGMLSQ